MFPDHVALLTVARIAESMGGSALPHAPVVDDALERRSAGHRLTFVRKRLAELIWPGELVVPSNDRERAAVPAGC